MKSFVVLLLATLFSGSVFAEETSYDPRSLDCSINNRTVEIKQGARVLYRATKPLAYTARNWLDQCDMNLREGQEQGLNLYIVDGSLSTKPTQDYTTCHCVWSAKKRKGTNLVLVFFNLGSPKSEILLQARAECLQAHRILNPPTLHCRGVY